MNNKDKQFMKFIAVRSVDMAEEEKKVYDKWCYAVDDSISPSNIYVCKCRIDRPLSNFEGYIETENGHWFCEYYDETVFNTYEEAEQARIKFLKDMLKEAEEGKRNEENNLS